MVRRVPAGKRRAIMTDHNQRAWFWRIYLALIVLGVVWWLA
jgi:hypothetical protein